MKETRERHSEGYVKGKKKLRAAAQRLGIVMPRYKWHSSRMLPPQELSRSGTNSVMETLLTHNTQSFIMFHMFPFFLATSLSASRSGDWHQHRHGAVQSDPDYKRAVGQRMLSAARHRLPNDPDQHEEFQRHVKDCESARHMGGSQTKRKL